MNQDKRIMVAFAVSFGVLLLWRVLFYKQPPPPPPKPAPSVTSPAASKGPSQPAPSPAAAPSSRTPAKVELPVVRGTQAQEIVVESDLYRVTFSSQGAVIKSWLLKQFRDRNDNLLDVVDAGACAKLGFPMSLSVSDEELKAKLNDAVFAANSESHSLRPPVQLEFTYSDGKVRARKKFSFGPGYEAHAEISLFDGQHDMPVEVAWPGGLGDHSLDAATVDSKSQAVYGTSEKLTAVSVSKVKEDQSIPAPLQVAGLEDKYFAGIFLPDSPEQTFRFGRREWTPDDWKGKDKDKPKPLTALLGTASAKPLAFRLFVAPKALDVLRGANPPLDGLVDFGWFSVVAKPLFLGLRFIHDRWIHNYGWAIVCLTVFINFAMFPLKLKSIKSAQEMQRIAPQVKSIQEKYKQYKMNDPRKQKMNQEMMDLYKEHNINPLGGCLPMILQLPFLYGFYRVLDLSIELRHAPWILWIKDLSSPDKFHLLGFPLPILPTVMIITMFIVQKMTPVASADPAQQRMMMIMPLVFGIMFYNFACGLVLYWLTSNIVGIAQQAFINRFMPAAPLPQPPARKAAKN